MRIVFSDRSSKLCQRISINYQQAEEIEMGRSPCRCCQDGADVKKGPWTEEEDRALVDYIQRHGGHAGRWRNLTKAAGLNRCAKSCRLRWINYLRPDIKRGNFTDDEERLIIGLHAQLGNKYDTRSWVRSAANNHTHHVTVSITLHEAVCMHAIKSSWLLRGYDD
jgi:hypothetical protein